MEISAPPIMPHVNRPTGGDLRKAAQEVEVQFLTEMFKIAGLGKPPEAFGGGIGEGQFSSFLAEQQARQVVESGGIGLAETIFKSLTEKADARDKY